jgi:hypothetical protein
MEVILKKQIVNIVATLTLIIPMAILGIAGLNGKVSADIPFDFTVGNEEFKAGKYTVGKLSNNNTAGTLVIRSEDNGAVANFIVNDLIDKRDSQPRLIFRRYGNQYFLAKIFDGYSGQGAELMKSKTEREAAKKSDSITKNMVVPEIVEVVAPIGQ